MTDRWGYGFCRGMVVVALGGAPDYYAFASLSHIYEHFQSWSLVGSIGFLHFPLVVPFIIFLLQKLINIVSNVLGVLFLDSQP